MARLKLRSVLIRPRGSSMKSFTALIAVAILYVVDSHYNDGRYTQVLQQAVTSLLPG